VHGDPTLVPFEASFPAAPEIADRLIYTGYVGPAPPCRLTAADGQQVIVSAGGGAAGRTLLETALAARRAGCLAHLSWRLITGTNLADGDFMALRANAPAGVGVERFRGDFVGLLRACRVSVSQAGYNTVLDLLTAGARAVLVPFAAGRETEQPLRAERLAALGAAELVRESELSAATLVAAIDRAAARPPPSLAIDTDGAMRSARLIAGIIRAEAAGAGSATDRFASPAVSAIVA
jgi:predicted glycosyltransferase